MSNYHAPYTNGSPELAPLVKDVVANANAKGARIVDFKVLSNGKAVLYPHPSRCEPPNYYGSCFCLIDSLIHRYNLKKQYQFLYQRQYKDAERRRREEYENGLSLEAYAIQRCDTILRINNYYELLGADRYSVYGALSSLLEHSASRRGSFKKIKSALTKHYRRKIDEAIQVADRVKLKQIVDFFDSLDYYDLA